MTWPLSWRSTRPLGKWRRRFVERRLEGLFDEPRLCAKCTVTDDLVEPVVKTLEEKPVDATHGSTRSKARWSSRHLS